MSKFIVLILNIVYFLVSFTEAQLSTICNRTIITLTGSDRDITYTDATSPNYCDAGLSLRWYTFGADAKIPEFCPKVDDCLADTPYWTKDVQPTPTSPGPFTISLCASQSLTGNGTGCTADCSLKIQTAYCSNINSIVYEFPPVPLCNLRYCYKKLKPCIGNQFSNTGYEPCLDEYPLDTNGTLNDATFKNPSKILIVVFNLYYLFVPNWQ